MTGWMYLIQTEHKGPDSALVTQISCTKHHDECVHKFEPF